MSEAKEEPKDKTVTESDPVLRRKTRGAGLKGDDTPSGPNTERTAVRAKRELATRKEHYPEATPPSTSPEPK